MDTRRELIEWLIDIHNEVNRMNNKKIYTKNTLEIKINNKYANKISFNDISYSDRIEMFYDGLKQASVFFENF